MKIWNLNWKRIKRNSQKSIRKNQTCRIPKTIVCPSLFTSLGSDWHVVYYSVEPQIEYWTHKVERVIIQENINFNGVCFVVEPSLMNQVKIVVCARGRDENENGLVVWHLCPCNSKHMLMYSPSELTHKCLLVLSNHIVLNLCY